MTEYKTSIIDDGVRSELSSWMTPEGLELSLFMGANSEPVIEGLVLYKDLIDQELEACRMPSGDKTSLFGQYDHHADLFVEALEEAAAYARKELEFRRA